MLGGIFLMCHLANVMVMIDRLEIDDLSIDHVEDKVEQQLVALSPVAASSDMAIQKAAQAQATPNRTVIRLNGQRAFWNITGDHAFWYRGQEKLCDLLKNATNVDTLDWKNVPSNELSEQQRPLFNLVMNCSERIHGGMGSGNWITAFYMARIATTLARVDLKFQCREGMVNFEQELLPWFTGTYPAPKDSDEWPLDFEPPTENMACTNRYPFIPLHLASHIIQSDMRRIAVAVMGDRGYDTSGLDLGMIKSAFNNEPNTTISKMLPTGPLAPDVKLDEAAIHFRCGDVLGGANRYDFGVIKFDEYKRNISPKVRSIGILTQPFNKTLLRRQDRGKTENCRKVVGVLVDYLQEAFPKATVAVHNGVEDTMPITYARLIMAKQTIISLSSFGIFPAMGTFGDGYFQVGNRGVNPFNTRVPEVLQNTHIMTGPKLATGSARKKSLDEIIEFFITPREDKK